MLQVSGRLDADGRICRPFGIARATPSANFAKVSNFLPSAETSSEPLIELLACRPAGPW